MNKSTSITSITSINAVYLTDANRQDAAVMRGLHEGNCIIHEVNSISESIEQITRLVSEKSAGDVMLVADVQAGSFVLLTLLSDAGIRLPNVLMYNTVADDIQSVIRAIQMRVKDYLVLDDPASHKELRTRMMVEEMLANTAPAIVTTVPASPTLAAEKPPADQKRGIIWDPETHFIYCDNDQMLHLSPIEGKVFGLLYMNRKTVVYTEKIVKQCLGLPGVDRKTGTRLLRPHILRLRRKLNRYPVLVGRIVNVRTTGYMFT